MYSTLLLAIDEVVLDETITQGNYKAVYCNYVC